MTTDRYKVSFQNDDVLELAVMVLQFSDYAKTTQSTKKTEYYPYTLFLKRLIKSGHQFHAQNTDDSVTSTYQLKFCHFFLKVPHFTEVSFNLFLGIKSLLGEHYYGIRNKTSWYALSVSKV